MTVGRGILVAGEARTAIMWSRLTSVRFLAVGTGSLGRSGAAGVLQAVNTASVGPAATRAMAFNPRRQQEESELEMKLIEVKRTVQMTAKGRMRTMSALVCVGNGNGGIGEWPVSRVERAFHLGRQLMEDRVTDVVIVLCPFGSRIL